MSTVVSRDGTPIAFEKTGEGPPLVFVDGALCHRAFGPSRGLAKVLAPHFTVFTYDRRGRGESGDTAPYAVQREVEDLAALLGAAGGSPYVYGVSSGAALALEAANRGLPIRKLALYEAPFIVDATRTPIPDDFLDRLQEALAAGRRGDAVRNFMKLVGAPGFAIAIMRLLPVWSKLKKVAHTLPYDITLVREHERGQPFPAGRWGSVTAPTLVMDGSKSPEWMRNAMRALAKVVPGATYRSLDGQTHMITSKAHVAPLVEFLV